MEAIPDLLERIRGEFLEMPGLKLSIEQACRLWNQVPPAGKASAMWLV